MAGVSMPNGVADRIAVVAERISAILGPRVMRFIAQFNKRVTKPIQRRCPQRCDPFRTPDRSAHHAVHRGATARTARAWLLRPRHIHRDSAVSGALARRQRRPGTSPGLSR